MRAGQSNAVKGEVAGKDTLPTEGVKGSGVTADSMASAVQAGLMVLVPVLHSQLCARAE